MGHVKMPLDAVLAEVTGWVASDGREAIEKRFTFADFNAAFAFMTRCAMRAEQLDHHPEWRNVYNKVDVVLTTHDIDGISDRDLAMAQFMDAVAGV